MSIVLQGSTSGSVTLQEPAVAGTTVLDLPATSGTVLVGGTQNIPKAALPTGSVLQVISSTKTDTASTTTTGSWLDVTGLSVSITPTTSSSKIMIFGRLTGAGTSMTSRLQMRLVRDSTAISIGDASSNRLQVSGGELYYGADNSTLSNTTITFLDSPATTSSTTYKLQIRNGNASATIYVNRTESNPDNNTAPVATSSITVMEIAA